MTKKEREVLQKYFNRIREFQTKGNETFNKLMELNGAEGTGHRWCCASENLRDLLSVGTWCGTCKFGILEKFIRITGKFRSKSKLMF